MGINWRRKLFHIASSLFFFGLLKILQKPYFQIFLLFTAGLVLLWEFLRLRFPAILPFKSLWESLLKESEKKTLSDALFFILGVLISSLMLSGDPLGVAILILGISDPLAAITGAYLKRGPTFKNKSLSGTLSFFLSSFTIALFFLKAPLSSLLGLSLFLSLVELFTTRDNLWIPIACAVYLRIFDTLTF